MIVCFWCGEPGGHYATLHNQPCCKTCYIHEGEEL